MTISESQLETWSHQGATTTAKQSHESVRHALASYRWPSTMNHDDYLQGSYANSTNIRANSDVDLVVETTNIAYSNLTQEEKQKLGLGTGKYTLNDFRSEALSALRSYYSPAQIDDSGRKSIRVLKPGGNLDCDVVVCARYNHYENLRIAAKGIKFWTHPDNLPIVNYPKLHISNGVTKNANSRTNGWFKPTVRMFKNARDHMVGQQPELASVAPSYFVECLIYNIPDSSFGSTFQATYTSCVNWLNENVVGGNENSFVTQSHRHYLFGTAEVQGRLSHAQSLIGALVSLWR